ncbi:hypothetical protein F4604DRAFT_1766186 [Suillus subluteus]|nr:hypothetical protein F4604DRAFT_1766186 [Suillus subluteus]
MPSCPQRSVLALKTGVALHWIGTFTAYIRSTTVTIIHHETEETVHCFPRSARSIAEMICPRTAEAPMRFYQEMLPTGDWGRSGAWQDRSVVRIFVHNHVLMYTFPSTVAFYSPSASTFSNNLLTVIFFLVLIFRTKTELFSGMSLCNLLERSESGASSLRQVDVARINIVCIAFAPREHSIMIIDHRVRPAPTHP